MGGYIGGNGGVTQVDGYNKTEVDSKVSDKVEDNQVLTDVPANAVFTDTTYSIQDGELSQNNFTNADHSKLDGIATGANNYTHPSAHSISFITGLQTALDGKVDDSQVLTNVPSGAVFTDTNTTYTVGDGGLTQKNFTTTLKTKLDGIETSADVTDVTNVKAALTALSTGTDAVGGDFIPVYDASAGTWEKQTITNAALQGPTGATGATGPAGADGAIGADGQMEQQDPKVLRALPVHKAPLVILVLKVQQEQQVLTDQTEQLVLLDLKGRLVHRVLQDHKDLQVILVLQVAKALLDLKVQQVLAETHLAVVLLLVM